MTFATADAFARCMTFLRKRLQRRFDLAGAFDVIIHPAARSQVFDDGQRAALVDQVSGSLLGGVRSPVLERAIGYWKSIDADVGAGIEQKVRAGRGDKPAEGMGEG